MAPLVIDERSEFSASTPPLADVGGGVGDAEAIALGGEVLLLLLAAVPDVVVINIFCGV